MVVKGAIIMQTPQQPDRSQERPDASEQPQADTVTRSVDIDAGVEDVWPALATDEGRQSWIEPDPERVLIVDSKESPGRISWWWRRGEEPATHVVLRVVAIPTGTRVIVTETAPSSFPLAQLAASFHRTLVFA
jgi:uncharacterized protein YndB with AHSA1/START domain